LLPLIFFVVANLLSFIFYEIGKLFWQTNEKNLLSAAAGSGNTGYFGLPLVLSLFGDKGLSIAVFCLLGTILYESTRNYYILAKSHATAREALLKVLKLPSFYAFVLGLIVNRLGLTIDGWLLETFTYFKGAYVVFGMMIIGIVLASATKGHFDMKFTGLAFIAKFIGYPSLIGLFVILDSTTFGLFSTQVHSIMMLLSIVPMAANTVTYAAFLKTHPEKAALTVMASTIFALLYVPAFITLIIKP
jgi:predicted permease